MLFDADLTALVQAYPDDQHHTQQRCIEAERKTILHVSSQQLVEFYLPTGSQHMSFSHDSLDSLEPPKLSQPRLYKSR